MPAASYSKKFKQAKTWMNLENIMLSKRNQSPKMWFHLQEIYRIGKYTHSWSELTGEDEKWLLMGMTFLFKVTNMF